MKRKLFLLLFVIVASSSAVFAATYRNIKYGDLYFDLTRGQAHEENTAVVVAHSSYTALTSVTIPATVRYDNEDYYVHGIGDRAFQRCTSLTSITFNNVAIHRIGHWAFQGCTGLTTLLCPPSLSEIMNQAFDGCTNLASIKIPGGVSNIGAHAFRNCTSLIDFEFPEDFTIMEHVGTGAFENICNVKIPYTIQTLDGSVAGYPWGARAINGHVDGLLVYVTQEKTALCACSSAASGNITIPSSVDKIQDKAFIGCDKITSITIPNSVTSIWKDAFYGCTGLTQIDIPNSVTEIRSGAFGKCSGLTSITIPNSVTSIGDSAFIACENIVTAQIPGSVTVINNNTFKNCRKLGSFTIQDNVTSIGSYAFYGTNINAIVIPGNVTEIGDYAFANCRNLKNVTLGKKITQMNGNAFSNPSNNIDVYWDIPSFSSFDFSQTNVKSITFGNSVTRIPDGICSGQSNLSKLEFLSDEITEIGANAFNECTSLSYIQHFPDSLRKIKANAFNNAPLISITIPVNVNEIGANAFTGCNPKIVYWNADGSSLDPSNVDLGNQIEELHLGEQVKIIHPYLFRDQTKIKELYIPTGRIKTGAFMGCSGLHNLSFGIGVTKFDGTAFKNCTNISGALILPDALDTIPTGAFDNCTKITSVTIGKKVKKISGFEGCTGIKTVYNFSRTSLVPHAGGVDNPAYYADIVYNNMEIQGDYIFSGTSLIGYMGHGTDITLPADHKGSTYRIDKNVFLGATQISSITIPEAVSQIQKSAFEGCIGLNTLAIPNSVEFIGEMAFKGCSNIATITFGANLDQLGENAFANCTNIQEITCSAVAPPTAKANTFSNVPTSATLKIPAGSRNAYQNALGWSHFTNIVETNLVNVTGITLSATTINLKKGDEAVLYASVKPNNATYKTVTWSTSNSSIVEVTNGIVYGKNAGTATITCTTNSGGYSATCNVTVSTNAILATGFQFYKYAARNGEVYVPYSEMNEGDTLTFMELGKGFITINVMPYSVTNGNIDFSISDPSIISAELTEHINFANSIKISPLRPGVSKITISTTDGSNITKSVYVKITPDPTIKVIGVRCLIKELTIGTGEKDTIEAMVLPFDATNANVSWLKTSEGSPLSVNIKALGFGSNRCEITAKSVGTTYIYVKTSDGEYTDTCAITVIKKIPVTGLSLNQTSKTLNVGESVQLTPVFTPSNATNQKVYWNMDNDTVATIENGLVTAIHEGTVVVTCITDDGSFTASCSISVQENSQPPITEPIIVRLKASSASGWPSVYLWAWTSDGDIFSSWPGQMINKDSEGWYSYTFAQDISNVNIIWNNGSGAQTKDITGIIESTCYALNSTSGSNITVSIVDCETQGIEDIPVNMSITTQKVLIDGQIFILRGNKTYTLQGQEVK